MGRYLRGPLEQMSLLIEDRLKYSRAIRLIRLQERIKQELDKSGGDLCIQSLDVRFALDALEEGSFEEDDDLQDMWARLIANAIDANSGSSPRRAYISMLKDMSHLDAVIFEVIYNVPEIKGGKAIVTSGLPHSASRADEIQLTELIEPSDEVKVSLSNLARLGVIGFGASWGGGEVYKYVNKTLAGKELMAAIRR